MTLSEIENILEELSKRHPDLSKDMLTTMLVSSGWEDKVIKEALTLFNQKHPQKTQPATTQAVVASKKEEASSGLTGDRASSATPHVQHAQVTQPHVVRSAQSGGGGWLFRLFGITLKESPHPQVSSIKPISAPVAARTLESVHAEQAIMPQVPASVPVQAPTPAPVPAPAQIPQLPVQNKPAPVMHVGAPVIVVHTEKPQVMTQSPAPQMAQPSQAAVATNSRRESSGNGNWLARLFGFTFKEINDSTSKVAQPVAAQTPVISPVPRPQPVPPPKVMVYTQERAPAPVIENVPIIVNPPLLQQEVKPSPSVVPSLIVANEPAVLKPKEVSIPHDLPIVPFESSPHVVSFSEYKDLYHKEQSVPKVEEKSAYHPQTGIVTEAPLTPKETELLLEKTPMTKGDEGLVVLASIMLFVIILILGYMYSNGRL